MQIRASLEYFSQLWIALTQLDFQIRKSGFVSEFDHTLFDTRCCLGGGKKSDADTHCQPPIADIDRAGWRKPGSLTPWPGSLPHVDCRHRSAIS